MLVLIHAVLSPALVVASVAVPVLQPSPPFPLHPQCLLQHLSLLLIRDWSSSFPLQHLAHAQTPGRQYRRKSASLLLLQVECHWSRHLRIRTLQIFLSNCISFAVVV